MSTLRLWKDVPLEERIDEAFLRTKNGAYGPDGEAWVQRNLRTLQNPQCAVALRWANTDRWHPCRSKTPLGGSLCVFHGGPKVPKPSAAEKEIDRLYERIEALKRRKLQIEEHLLSLESLVARLESE